MKTTALRVVRSWSNLIQNDSMLLRAAKGASTKYELWDVKTYAIKTFSFHLELIWRMFYNCLSLLKSGVGRVALLWNI